MNKKDKENVMLILVCLIACLAIIVLLSSCKTKQPVILSENRQEKQLVDVSKTKSDSTIYRQTAEVKVETIKADTVQLNLDPAEVARLPTGASFYRKSGRATINVRQAENGNMEISATCDSLNVFYESLKIEYERYREMTNDSINSLNTAIVKVKSQPAGDNFWSVTGKIATAIISIVFILFFIIKKWK